jgi:hypothetical protein
MTKTTTFNWVTTLPHPYRPAHTHGADDGQVGWKLHAVEMGRDDDFTKEAKRRQAICGVRPRHGWGLDLFIDAECTKCVKAMKKREAAGEVFADLAEIREAERKARACPACGLDPKRADDCDIPDDQCPRFGAK